MFFRLKLGPPMADPRHHRLSREKHTAAFNLADGMQGGSDVPNMLSSKMFRLRLFNMLTIAYYLTIYIYINITILINITIVTTCYNMLRPLFVLFWSVNCMQFAKGCAAILLENLSWTRSHQRHGFPKRNPSNSHHENWGLERIIYLNKHQIAAIAIHYYRH